VRAVLLLAVAAVAAVFVCGASAASRPSPIHFGQSGGNIRGYSVTIKPNGKVTITGAQGVNHLKITAKRARRLRHEIQNAHLSSQTCGNMPDAATQFIRLGAHTFTMRGSCNPRFQRVWSDLAKVVGSHVPQ
jgi:hypothetical protein